MSNADDYEYENEDQPEPDPQPKPRELRKQIDALNAENAQLRQQAEQADTLARENAIFKANLGNLNEAQQAAVIATAKEVSADALRSQAELLGFVAPPEPAVPDAELDAQARIAGAQTGGTELNEATYEAELRGTRNEAEALAVMAKYNKPVVFGNDA